MSNVKKVVVKKPLTLKCPHYDITVNFKRFYFKGFYVCANCFNLITNNFEEWNLEKKIISEILGNVNSGNREIIKRIYNQTKNTFKFGQNHFWTLDWESRIKLTNAFKDGVGW